MKTVMINENKIISGQKVAASVTSAVAMVNNNKSDTIEVKRNPIRIADVFVNGNQVDIDDTTISYLQFKGNIRREEMNRIL